MSDTNVGGGPSAAADAVHPSETFDAAGFWIRASARLLDWVVLTGVTLAVGVMMVLVAAILESVSGRPAANFIASMERNTFIGWIGSTMAALAYHIGFESIAGSTVGKRLLRLQIISVAARPITFLQAVKRSLGFLVDALFFGAIAAHEMNESSMKQRVGDKWADTRVVRRSSLPPELYTPTWRLIAGFFLAAFAASVFVAATQMCEFLWMMHGA